MSTTTSVIFDDQSKEVSEALVVVVVVVVVSFLYELKAQPLLSSSSSSSPHSLNTTTTTTTPSNHKMPPPYNLDELCLQDLFIEQASKTPNAVAVVDGEIELTYQELDHMTDKLAVLLHTEYAVGPDSVVGILMPRSVQYVVAYVAILKAGGAYMPLELVYPKKLLERAVEQTEAKLVLTTSDFQSRVSNKPHYCIDDVYDLLHLQQQQDYPKSGFTPRPNADHLAFVVMSSGTTGVPKGICQVHRSAVHSYMDRWDRYPYHKEEASGQVQDRVGAGVFFVWELFRPLCQGATCVVIPDHVLFDPESVTKFVRTQNVTRILFTPSLLQLVLDTLPPATVQERFSNLRYMWLCGEVVTVDLATTFSEMLPHVHLLNLYSISECHDVSIGDLRQELDVSRKYATCGLRIPGVTFYIVDLESAGTDHMQLVSPSSETGEVFVGGPVIARGYLHMPEKTAERFVPNPFDDSCDKLYRTGDLGRLLPNNGQLEVLGRCDFMVKIRGYSVVLGAVESALAKHPKLCSAVVLAVGPEGTDKKLVAYVVPMTWEDAPSAASVRSFLKDHLPPYAIPGTFCVIDALPVGPSAAGKLDRKNLPDVAVAKRLRAFSQDLTMTTGDVNATVNVNVNTRLAPQNDMERLILDIWTLLLNVSADDLSMRDSFFEVGGHSLLATRLVSQVNQKLGLDTETGLSIIGVVQAPTIRDMADTLLHASKKEALPKINLNMEADALDPSIYPFATRKGDTISRFRLERTLLTPRVVFLTGATGYLGVHILAELLQAGTTVVCLARASDDDAAQKRILDNLKKYQLLEGVLESLLFQQTQTKDEENPQLDTDTTTDDISSQEELLENHLHAVAGDLSKPLLGMDISQFKTVALEVDSIIHCGAQVNLIKPYQALKESNVLGTQEILRLATTNGFIKTKVKPVHYISTNGIFPVDANAYSGNNNNNETSLVNCTEDWDLQDPAICENLSEGYSMTKWVAERMCAIAESRGLPISVMRPGNMAGSTITGAQNRDDLNYLFVKGMLELQCSPDLDRGSAYAMDLTPVNFAAKAVVQLAVQTPSRAIGQRFHLQNAQDPVLLQQVTEWLREAGHVLTSVTRDDFFHKLQAAAQEERNKGVETSVLQQLESGFEAFETYFTSSTWLRFGSDNLHQALGKSGVACPPLSMELLKKWFPLE
jgi:amino acid adenylation domain-containing protein/thioester reductase-like protein